MRSPRNGVIRSYGEGFDPLQDMLVGRAPSARGESVRSVAGATDAASRPDRRAERDPWIGTQAGGTVHGSNSRTGGHDTSRRTGRGSDSRRDARGPDATLELSLLHLSEPPRQAENSYAVFCLEKKTTD